MTAHEGSSSLTILSGAQSGTGVPLASGETLVGSDPGCQLRVAGASPIHVRIQQKPEGYVATDGGGPAGVWRNDDRIVSPVVLRDSDILWLGPPGEPSSIMVQCRLVATPAPTLAASDSEFVMDPVPEGSGTPAFAADEVFFVDPSAAPPTMSPAAPAVAADEPFFVSDEAPVSFPVATPVVGEVAEPAWEPPAPAPPPTPAAPSAPAPPRPPVPELVFVTPIPDPPKASPPAPPPLVIEPARPAAPAAVAAPPPAPAPGTASPSAPSADAPAPRAPRPRPPASSTAPARSARPPAALPPRRSSSGPPLRILLPAAGAILLVVIGAVAFFSMRTPSLIGVAPERVRVGDTITLTGKNFSSDPNKNEVLFGDVIGRVAEASSTELRVVVPSMRLLAGEDTPLSLKVRSAGRETQALSLTVFQAPKITQLVPDVAMPGQEISIEGSGWRDNASVRFGSQPANVVSGSSTVLRVRVPGLEGAPGTTVPVIVMVGGGDSGPATFTIGELPLVTAVEPAQAAPGDVLHVKGKGFSLEPEANHVRIASTPVVVVAASETDLTVVVPRLPPPLPGEVDAAVEVSVDGLTPVGQGRVGRAPAGDPVDLRFIVEPFRDAAGHLHATLGTELGPAFVLSASGGKTAAQRAAEARERWNQAAAQLKASLDEQIGTRTLDTHPSLALKSGKLLLEVTEEDAAAYNEGWLKPEPKSPAVTPARLAVWWEAIARDLVLLLLRGKSPEFAADLGTDGRVLTQIFAHARKTGRFGVPREVLGSLKPAEHETLRALALRVPATVIVVGDRASATGSDRPPPTGPVVAAGALRLVGDWQGVETESGRKRTISLRFEGEGGTLTYSGGIALTVPLMNVQQPQKGAARFSAIIRGGTRHYVGRWDGERITGTITQEEAAGPVEVGTFELSR